MTKRKNKSLPFIIYVILTLLIVVVAYVIYVFSAYYRLGDGLSLSVEGAAGYKGQAISKNAQYSVMTWNIGFGAYSPDYSFFMDGGKYSRALSKQAVYDNLNGVIDITEKYYPDFIFFQETDRDGTRSFHVDEAELLTSSLNVYSYSFAQNYDSPYLFYPIFSPHGKNTSGMLTLSAYECESAIRRSLPIDTGVMKIVDLDRCYSVTRLPVSDGGYLCLYNVHLSAYASDRSVGDAQLKMLLSDMEAEFAAGNYVICGGDFNMDLLGDSSEYFGVAGDYTWAKPIPDGAIPEGFSVSAPINKPSCRNADKPYEEGSSFVLTVDGFIVSANVEVASCETVEDGFEFSDHNPVLLRFSLK